MFIVSYSKKTLCGFTNAVESFDDRAAAVKFAAEVNGTISRI